MSTQSAKGFTVCGQYYIMGDEQECYIEYCKRLMSEIRENARSHKIGGCH